MKRIVSISLILVALAVIGMVPAQILAFGRAKASACCEPVVCCEAPAPCPPKMVEMKVTRYKQEWKEEAVTVNVCKVVPREEQFTYNVSVPVTTQEKRTVTT